MVEYGLGEVVRNGLVAAGCDPALIRELDDHGTIQIDLDGSPNMYIAKHDGQVLVWSDLCDFHEGIVRHQAESLVRLLMDGYAYSRNGQLILRESDGRLQLLADLASIHLDDEQVMAAALDTFYQCLLRTTEIVRQ